MGKNFVYDVVRRKKDEAITLKMCATIVQQVAAMQMELEYLFALGYWFPDIEGEESEIEFGFLFRRPVPVDEKICYEYDRSHTRLNEDQEIYDFVLEDIVILLNALIERCSRSINDLRLYSYPYLTIGLLDGYLEALMEENKDVWTDSLLEKVRLYIADPNMNKFTQNEIELITVLRDRISREIDARRELDSILGG
ncbi:MAG: hypothetical protein WC663_03645 [Patescibacteria group bacterium]